MLIMTCSNGQFCEWNMTQILQISTFRVWLWSHFTTSVHRVSTGYYCCKQNSKLATTVPHMHHWMRVPGHRTQRDTNIALWAIWAYCHCIRAITEEEERGTDLLVLSSYSSYSCCGGWAGKRPLLPFAALPQRAQCHPGNSWGFAEGDRNLS